MQRWIFAAGLLAMMVGSPAMAESPQPLTLERVFASPAISGPTPRAVRLSLGNTPFKTTPIAER